MMLRLLAMRRPTRQETRRLTLTQAVLVALVQALAVTPRPGPRVKDTPSQPRYLLLVPGVVILPPLLLPCKRTRTLLPCRRLILCDRVVWAAVSPTTGPRR
uniref:Uncharacterized protein n=1 Tax=Cacopsylla melanoneura TaxID=428564 RepID=A0A8D8ZRX4_9HEMI